MDTSHSQVGMATNIPPHNLGELVDALSVLIHNPEATVVVISFRFLGNARTEGRFCFFFSEYFFIS